jgi:hypothetical protein
MKPKAPKPTRKELESERAAITVAICKMWPDETGDLKQRILEIDAELEKLGKRDKPWLGQVLKDAKAAKEAWPEWAKGKNSISPQSPIRSHRVTQKRSRATTTGRR